MTPHASALRAMKVAGVPSSGFTKTMSVGARRGVSIDRNTTGFPGSSAGIAWTVPFSKNRSWPGPNAVSAAGSPSQTRPRPERQ